MYLWGKEHGKGRHSYTSTYNLSHTGITILTKNAHDMNNSIHICRHTGTKHNPSVSQTSSRHKQITLVSGTVAGGYKLRKNALKHTLVSWFNTQGRWRRLENRTCGRLRPYWISNTCSKGQL